MSVEYKVFKVCIYLRIFVQIFFVYSLLMFIFRIIFSPSNLSLYLLQMTIKGGLFVLILAVLVLRSSTPIARQCFPSGFLHFQPFIHFRNPEDTGLLWMYALYTPPRPKKLSRTHLLLRTRSLILVILLIGCVESNPGEFL